jgi:hypothetical protein
MNFERAFSCGNNKYYVTEHNGYLVVQRQDWLKRAFLGYARDIAAALALITHDARSSEIKAQPRSGSGEDVDSRGGDSFA